jgi:hypothetical protein
VHLAYKAGWKIHAHGMDRRSQTTQDASSMACTEHGLEQLDPHSSSTDLIDLQDRCVGTSAAVSGPAAHPEAVPASSALSIVTTPVVPMESQTQQSSGIGWLYKFNRTVNGGIERGFAVLGRFIAKRPVLVIVGSVVIALGLACGMFNTKYEQRCGAYTSFNSLGR